MTGMTAIRIPTILVSLFLALGLMVSPTDSSIALAKGRTKSASTKKVTKKESSKKKAKSSRKRRSRRTYTLRGNPEVTRTVSTKLLVEKLPDLAALVGLQASPSQEVVPANESSTSQSDASKGITGAFIVDAYQDSELDDNEDTDGITAEDLEGLEELPTDINSFYKEFTKYMASLNGESTITDNGIDKVVVMETLMDWVGTRYLFGGMGRNGIDCSAFTGMLYRTLNYKLPRTAAAQWEVGMPIEKEDLQFGDLIFFNTRKAVYVSHVGIYLGNGIFAHASSRNGVTVSSLNTDYYSSHMIGARRYDFNSVMTASSESSTDLSHN